MTTAVEGPHIPSAYVEGFERAREVDPELAEIYVRHTMITDPLADAAMESLTALEPAQAEAFIQAGMDGDAETMRGAPEALRTFFDSLDPPAGMLDPARVMPGIRAFHRYSDVYFLGLLIDSIVTGFSTNVSKAFYMRGRLAGNLRRLQQNTRHIVEITLPGGLERHGDGWKLTIRIRLTHARVRRLLLESGEWDVEADGLPLHAAHIALAASGFSANSIVAVGKLGIRMEPRERDDLMHIWRYVIWLLGVPEEIFFNDIDEAMHLKEIGYLCEPRPDVEASTMAHAIITSVPDLMDITDPGQKQKITSALYRASRALIGDELADALDYPKQSTFGALALVRTQRRLQMLASRFIPGVKPHSFNNFAGLLQRSVYDDDGISYRLPDAVKDSESTPW